MAADHRQPTNRFQSRVAWRRLVILWLVMIVPLSGCTGLRQYWANGYQVGPDYLRPPAPVAADWIDAGDVRVRSEWPDDHQWWLALNDPVLTRLIYMSYGQNLTLREAGMLVTSSRARRAIAAGTLFPQLQEAFGRYDRVHRSGTVSNRVIDPNFSDWSTGFNLGWELDFWGRFRRAVEAADADLDASVENYDDVLVCLLAEVAAAYIEVRTFEERIRLARANVTLQVEGLRIAEARFRLGDVDQLDVTLATTLLKNTESLVPLFEQSRRAAQNRLCFLLGVPTHDLVYLLGPGPIPAPPPEVVVGIPADLLRRRPDVRRAEREAAAQSARIGIAASDFYPRIAVTGTIGLQSADFADLFNSASWIGSVGPSFNWNILNYGRIANNVRAQDAVFQQLAFRYQNQVLKANEEVENGLVGFLKSQERTQVLSESVAASQRSVELATVQYEEGDADYLRVLIAQEALVEDQDRLAQAQGEIALSLVGIYKALGGGWQIRCRPPSAAGAPQLPPDLPPPPAISPMSQTGRAADVATTNHPKLVAVPPRGRIPSIDRRRNVPPEMTGANR